MRNACSHSRGTRLDVELNHACDLVVRVRDDGIGIDRDLAAKEREGHFGVRGMQERAGRIGAELNFDPTGSGTEVERIVPGRLVFLDKEAPPQDLLSSVRRVLRLTR